VPGVKVCGGDAGGGGEDVDVRAQRPEVEHTGWGYPWEEMKLTGYGGKSKRVGAFGASGSSGASKARTTLPGFENLHGQTVVSRTGAPSTTIPGQVIYRMKCGRCGFEYGANGCEVHARRCPGCQEVRVESLCGRRRAGCLGRS
jgi:hypothetical protein